MKKTIMLLAILFASKISLFANPVNEETAKKVGQAFLTSKANSRILNSSTALNLTYSAVSENTTTTYFYIFNVDSNGFIIVSGDDSVTPILGYSDEGIFDINKISAETKNWLENYKTQIQFVIENNIPATSEIQNDWNDYIRNDWSNYAKETVSNADDPDTTVKPMIQTKWNQMAYYNDLCPYDNQYNNRTVTGCLATSFAQIMKYWNYPNAGTGSYSYVHPKYGTLSANFHNTYQWDLMPNSITESNYAISTLLFQLGVSFNTNYNVTSKGGSTASAITAVSALKTYFGYSDSIKRKFRSDFSDADWKNLLKYELNAERPLLYSGFNEMNQGHTFICDGYDSNDYFHFNWGWGGESDGYFLTDNLNPKSSINFNQNQQVFIEIQPKNQSDINLGTDHFKQNAISVYPNPTKGDLTIKMNEGFESLYQLFDTNGRIVLQGTLNDLSAKIEVSNQKPGIYLLTITNLINQKRESIKIIIE